MKAKCLNTIVCLIILVFFCILACDNGSVSDSSAAKSSGLVNVSLTVDKSSDSQKSISVDSNYDPASLKFFYRATPKWSQDQPIHGSTNNQFILIPNYTSGSTASLGSFTAGRWVFEVQVKYGSTLVYQGTSAVTSIYSNNASVNVMLEKATQVVPGTVSVTVTAPTVDDEALTVAWTGTDDGSGTAAKNPLGNGTTEFTYTTSGLTQGTYTFTLNHSYTGAGAAVAVDLRPGERAEITGHLENGVWQVGCVIVKVHSITKNFVNCNYQINLNSAAAGDKVSFYLDPYSGNVLQGTVNVTWAGGSIGELVPVNGLYTFEMPDADVTINAVYSGVGSDIEIPLFKSLFKILLDSHPSAELFGYDSGSVEGDYFEIKGVKLWYKPSLNKICWKNNAGTFRFKAGSMANFFKDCSNFTNINLSGIDTSNVTSMSGMFRGCEELTEVVLDSDFVEDEEDPRYGKFLHFNTKNVTDMSYMFCSKTIESGKVRPTAMKLATVDVSGLDTSSVTNMSYMFYMCYLLSTLNVSGFDTSSVTNMSNMFACYNYDGTNYPGHLTTLNLSGWNFANVITTAKMFDRQEVLNTGLQFPSETNFKSLTTMTFMFSHCLALTPATFENIVKTWKFSEHDPDYLWRDTIYGETNPSTSLFGNYENNNAGDNNGANYIFRENSQTKSGGQFYTRRYYETKDVDALGNKYRLYIGGGPNAKNARLTTKDSI